MIDLCTSCQLKMEFIPVGDCPECGTEGLMMCNATSHATCKKCGITVGIPMSRERLCESEVENTSYSLQLQGTITKEIMLTLAPILSIRSVDLCRIIKKDISTFENLTLIQVYKLLYYLRNFDLTLCFTPAPPLYTNFIDCWHI